MIHSPGGRNGRCYADPKPGARSFLQVCHMAAGSHSFEPSSPAFPGHRQGAGREAGLPPLEPVPICDPGLARQGPLTTCANAPGAIRDCYMEHVTSGTCCLEEAGYLRDLYMEQVSSGIFIWSRLPQGTYKEQVTSGNVIWSSLHQGPAPRVKEVTSGMLGRQGYLL